MQKFHVNSQILSSYTGTGKHFNFIHISLAENNINLSPANTLNISHFKTYSSAALLIKDAEIGMWSKQI